MTVNTCRQLFVIVPANNEAELIADCLASIKKSRNYLHRALRKQTRIIVVCDACTDNTAHIARRVLSKKQDVVVERCFHNVGRARACGASIAGQLSDRLSDSSCGNIALAANDAWYAFTDADTRVPTHWLDRQRAHCDDGRDMVLGVIDIDHATLDAVALGQFLIHYRQKIHAGEHSHVHGANLGIRASQYWTVGGFEPLAAHEDHELVSRMAATGACIVRDTALSVLTSSRLTGRVAAGVSCDLRRIVMAHQQAMNGYQAASICVSAC